MHFKSMIAAALLMSLGFVANADPTADVAPAAPAAPAAPVAGGSLSATGLIDGAIWPLGFTNQCNALYAISTNLDKEIKRALDDGHACNAAQLKIIKEPAKSCGALSIITSLIWPIAFAQQEDLSTRINAQMDCLMSYHRDICD
ncbi:MAG: hypothetical protein J3R72DRAFT_480550 [Linnemannia gamsii]|nr:MAG: hypothetical protein J3R72DRAFT_480550 [Linnemannia gamsii]